VQVIELYIKGGAGASGAWASGGVSVGSGQNVRCEFEIEMVMYQITQLGAGMGNGGIKWCEIWGIF